MIVITKGLMFIVLIFSHFFFQRLLLLPGPLQQTMPALWRRVLSGRGGFDFTRQDNHDKEYFPSLTLTYGLFERMDMGIGSAYFFVDRLKGKR